MAWYDNADTRGYNNMLGTQAWPEHNPNLFRNTGVGRFDPRNMMRPSNLSQDLGASTYQAPQLNTLGPNWQNELAGYGSTMDRGNIDNTWSSNIKNTLGNWKDTIGAGITGILDNTMLGKIAAMRDATNPRAGNYNPNLQSQIDFLESKGAHGVMDASGLNKITQGALQGKNLQSMFGTNDLIGMYNDQVARHGKTIEGFDDQWSRLKEDDPVEFARRKAIHQNRKKKAEFERDQVIANQQRLSDERAGVERQAGAAANQMTQRREGRGGTHMSRSVDRGGLGISQSQAQAVSDANRNASMGGWGLAQGGRAGYRNGEFVDEDINIQGPGFDVNENVEMAATSPFEMRINELMDEGMSWQEAYEIAAQEFATAEGDESLSEDGIASLV